MKPEDAKAVRESVAAKQADNDRPEVKPNDDVKPDPKDEAGPVPPAADYPLPPVDVLPESSAQVTSVVGGAAGQQWGLPKPVTQKELDDAAPAPKAEKKKR